MHDMERAGKLSLQEVLAHIPKRESGKPVIQSFFGHKISLAKKRLRVFLYKGTNCILCKLPASFFAVEKLKGDEHKWKLNLYAVDELNDEVLITIDHIHPKSLGGDNEMNNLQPMCFHCNVRKGNDIA